MIIFITIGGYQLNIHVLQAYTCTTDGVKEDILKISYHTKQFLPKRELPLDVSLDKLYSALEEDEYRLFHSQHSKCEL